MHSLRVQVPNNWVLGYWVIIIIVQVLGKYMIIGYLDFQDCKYPERDPELSEVLLNPKRPLISS